MTRITLDASVLFYAFDARDPGKQQQALDIIEAAAEMDCVLGLQAIGEFYVSAIRKLKVPPTFARDQAKSFMAVFETFLATANAHSIAAEEAAAGKFYYWDAVLLASAAQNGCTLILSEDKADGMRFGTLTICNPFGPNGLHATARAALGLG